MKRRENARQKELLPCLALPCLALPCLALPCLALPCLALPCLAGSISFFMEKVNINSFFILNYA
ncbi:hypothetical protein IB305_004906 [Salmonella enterica]|nr:hypothetical protein [Salmonella enterica]